MPEPRPVSLRWHLMALQLAGEPLPVHQAAGPVRRVFSGGRDLSPALEALSVLTFGQDGLEDAGRVIRPAGGHVATLRGLAGL